MSQRVSLVGLYSRARKHVISGMLTLISWAVTNPIALKESKTTS